MSYKKRLIEDKLLALSKHFPVLVLTGARQVGKTTLLSYLTKGIHIVTFDPVVDVGNARQDPELFLNHLSLPVLLDEVQYAPELLPVIKRYVDAQKAPGQYWLTGSQNFAMLKNISESLAGRAAVLSLYSMSLGELYEQPANWIARFISNPDSFLKAPVQRIQQAPKSVPQILWQGCYPGMVGLEPVIFQTSLASYLQTYLERDVRLLAEVSDWQEFSRFMQLIANLTAQEINYSQLGREIGVTPQTAQRWLNILTSSYQWLSLPSYTGNAIKRLSSKSKGYFADTGLACYLMRISSPEVLPGHPRLGALFETYAVMDILKQLTTLSLAPAVYHWRSHGGAEVDLLIEIDNWFFPIEIKCKSRPTKADISGIKAFRETYPNLNIAPGIVIAPVENILPLGENCFALPFDLV